MNQNSDPNAEGVPACSLAELQESSDPPHCTYCCQCGLKIDQTDPILRKREKRKQYKKRLKARHKAEQEQALRDMESIVKNIYSGMVTFASVEAQIEKCLSVDTNQQKFYEFINSLIRDEVQAIRKKISDYLLVLPTTGPPRERELIKKIFGQIKRVKQVSPEIQHILNEFVRRHFGNNEQDYPFQRNLDQMTYSFLVKNYLQRTSTSVDMQEHFVLLCQRIFDYEEYQQERHLFQLMMKAYNTLQPQGEIDESDYDPDQDESGSEWQEESTKDSIQYQVVQNVQSKSRRRRNRKKRLKEHYQSAEEQCDAMIKRMEATTIRPQQLRNCNVSEEWVQDIRQKSLQYRYK